MARITNLVHVLYNPDAITSEDDKKLTLKSLINALTALTCSSLMIYIGKQKRGEFEPEHIPTLDERNEADGAARGSELQQESMDELGYLTPEMPYKIACIANGIRHALYKELDTYMDLDIVNDHMDALLRTPVRGIDHKINWSQPMSAQTYMESRIKGARKVNLKEVEIRAKRKSTAATEQHPMDTVEDHAADAARLKQRMAQMLGTFTEAAVKSSERLAKLAPEVLIEVAGLGHVIEEGTEKFDETTGQIVPVASYTPDAFVALPIELQIRVAENVSASFNREYERLLPISVRKLDVSAECDLIEAQMKKLRRWVAEASHASRTDGGTSNRSESMRGAFVAQRAQDEAQAIDLPALLTQPVLVAVPKKRTKGPKLAKAA